MARYGLAPLPPPEDHRAHLSAHQEVLLWGLPAQGFLFYFFFNFWLCWVFVAVQAFLWLWLEEATLVCGLLPVVAFLVEHGL